MAIGARIAWTACAVLLLSHPARSADYILWEAENPAETDNRQTSNWMTSKAYKNKGELSGGAWFTYFAHKGKGGVFATYAVRVPSSGTYVLWVRKFYKHGPFTWTIDGAGEQTVGRNVKLWDTTALGGGVCLNWVRMGEVHLDEGAHSLKINIISDPARDTNASIDCFLLTGDTNLTPSGLMPPSDGAALKAAPRKRGGDSFFLRPGDTVLFLGDAITREGGYLRRARQRIAKEYPDLSRDEAASLRFVNEGVVGGTAGTGAGTLSGALSKRRPSVCVVCYGANDFYADRDRFATNVRSIVARLKSAKVAVTLMTPLALDPRGRDELAPHAGTIDRMAGEVRAIARDEGVPLADCHAASQRRIASGANDLSWGDGIHPGSAGRELMAEALLEAWGIGKPLQD